MFAALSGREMVGSANLVGESAHVGIKDIACSDTSKSASLVVQHDGFQGFHKLWAKRSPGRPVRTWRIPQGASLPLGKAKTGCVGRMCRHHGAGHPRLLWRIP